VFLIESVMVSLEGDSGFMLLKPSTRF